MEYELGETVTAAARYAELEETDPAIAGRFSYLGGTTDEQVRVSDGRRMADVVLWADAE